MKKDIINEINDAIVKLVNDEIVIGYNFPIAKGLEIIWDGNTSLSIALQNMPYHQKYSTMRANNSYSLLLNDESLIQMSYLVDAKDSEIQRHRLCYFPASNAYFEDQETHGFFESSYARFAFHEDYCIIPSIRFDYAPRQYTKDHPKTHLHIGEIDYFRLPVESPLSPVDFLSFILLNFYQYSNPLKRRITKNSIPKTITGAESNKSLLVV